MNAIIIITLDLIRYHLQQHPRYELDHSPWREIQQKWDDFDWFNQEPYLV